MATALNTYDLMAESEFDEGVRADAGDAIRDRVASEACCLCGVGPGEKCLSMFSGTRRVVLPWMHGQPKGVP
jgi:hypothetical protein